MILVDSNIIIDFWRHPTEEYKQIFLNNDIAICGLIKAELMHGAKTRTEIYKIQEALECFHYLYLYEEYWNDVGILLNKLKSVGISVPMQDVIISILSVRYNCLLWTMDKHFNFIKNIENKLILYSK